MMNVFIYLIYSKLHSPLHFISFWLSGGLHYGLHCRIHQQQLSKIANSIQNYIWQNQKHIFCKIYSNFWQQVQTNWSVTDLKVIKSHINSGLKWYSNYEILWNAKFSFFFQYFLKEAFKFCGALLLHYVFWVKRKGKIDSNESYYRGLPAFIVPNWGFWISWRRRRMEFLLTQITSKACFFVNIFIQLFLCILFLKITILL